MLLVRGSLDDVSRFTARHLCMADYVLWYGDIVGALRNYNVQETFVRSYETLWRLDPKPWAVTLLLPLGDSLPQPTYVSGAVFPRLVVVSTPPGRNWFERWRSGT